MKWSLKNFILPLLLAVLIIIVGLKFYNYPSTPASYNQDEISAVVESYALATNGTDRWGKPYPVYFESWGTGQNIAYSYLTIPFVKAFGVNAYTARAVQLIAGLITMLLVFLVLRALLVSKEIALFMTIISGAIDPLNNFFTWGLEAQILIPVWLTLVYSLIRSTSNRWWIIVGCISFSVSLYCYGLAIIWSTLPVLVYLFYQRKQLKKLLIPGLIGFIITLLPNLLYLNFLTLNYLRFKLFDSTLIGISTPEFVTTRLAETTEDSKAKLLLDNLGITLSGVSDGNTWFTVLPGNTVNIATALLTLLTLYVMWYYKSKLSLAQAMIFSSIVGLIISSWLFVINLNRVNIWMITIVICGGLALHALQTTKPQLQKIAIILFTLASLSGIYSQLTLYPKQIEGAAYVGVTDLIISASTLNTPQVFISRAVPINYVYPLFALPPDIKDWINNANYTKNAQGYYDVISYKQFVFTENALGDDFVAVIKKNQLSNCLSPVIIDTKPQFVLASCKGWK